MLLPIGFWRVGIYYIRREYTRTMREGGDGFRVHMCTVYTPWGAQQRIVALTLTLTNRSIGHNTRLISYYVVCIIIMWVCLCGVTSYVESSHTRTGTAAIVLMEFFYRTDIIPIYYIINQNVAQYSGAEL